MGKNVLNQKSELQKAMDKHRDQAARKEAEKEKLNNKTAFEKVIEERARRLESVSSTWIDAHFERDIAACVCMWYVSSDWEKVQPRDQFSRLAR